MRTFLEIVACATLLVAALSVAPAIRAVRDAAQPANEHASVAAPRSPKPTRDAQKSPPSTSIATAPLPSKSAPPQDCAWQAPVVTSPMPTPVPATLPLPRHSITGVVTAGGTPVANASISVYLGGYQSGASVHPPVGMTTTNPAGKYTVSVYPGTYRIHAGTSALDGFLASAFHPNALSFGTGRDVLVDRDVLAIGIEFARVYEVSGVVQYGVVPGAPRVYDGYGPVPGAEVSAFVGGPNALCMEMALGGGISSTDARGVFRLALPAGSYRIRVRPSRLSSEALWYGGDARFVSSRDVVVVDRAVTGIDVTFAPLPLVPAGTPDAVPPKPPIPATPTTRGSP
jgi:hypothetical protein